MNMLLRRWVLGALLVASCARAEVKPEPAQPSARGGGGDSGTGLGPQGPPVEPSACGFLASPVPFALPVIAGLAQGAFAAPSGEAKCVGGATFRYTLRDVDGDQQPDLVVESACDDPTIGLDAWNVYANTGTGFESAAKRFALPQPRLDSTCAKTTVADVDGDLKPDLVVTSLCTDPSVGTTRWLVYPNGASGFGPPAPFAQPGGAPTGAFGSFGPAPADCATGRPGYAFFDLDGDRKPDLVITTACDDPQIGTTAWRVYVGSGAGVGVTPIRFPLPLTPSVPVGTYGSAGGGGAGCDAKPAGPRYSVFDLDGDFRPDLVLTQDCTDTAVGSTRWGFYRNSGTGFSPSAEPIALPLVPGAAPVGAFPGLSAPPMCSGARQAPGFATLDVTGNLRPDLLVTRSCNDFTTGVSRWLLYRDTDGGFAPSVATFSLPAALGGSATAPLTLGGDAACSASPPRPAFFAAYLRQLKLDLVVTLACDDVSIGTSKWLLYEAACP
jgi:hypothetical protein